MSALFSATSKKKFLTLAQCQFLGERLQMENFEYLLKHSPRTFLEDMVRKFRLNIPYNIIHSGADFKRNGKFSIPTMPEIQREVYSGRGGSCTINTPFLDDFLRSVGFETRLVTAFNVGRTQKRDSMHLSVIARNVESLDDAFHMDVGLHVPCMHVADLTNVIPWNNNNNPERLTHATPILRSARFQYQLISGKRILSAFQQRQNQDDNRPLGKYIDAKQLEAELSTEKHDSLVMMVAKDDLVTSIRPQIGAESDGVWLPLHVMPAPLTGVGHEVIIKALERTLKEDPLCYVPTVFGPKSNRGIGIIAGFGKKTGEYLRMNGKRCVRCLGSSQEWEDEPTEREKLPVTMIVTSMENDEQVLALVQEEFPLLTDYAKEHLDAAASFVDF